MKTIILLAIYLNAHVEYTIGSGRRKYDPNSSELHYFPEITNISWTKGDYSIRYDTSNVQWKDGEYVRYYSGWVELFRMYHIAKVNIQIERCRNIRYMCEHYIAINYTDYYCTIARLTTYGWEKYIQEVTPKDWLKNCPRFEKGMYSLVNVTPSDRIKEAIAYYQDLPKYYWQGTGIAYGPKGEFLGRGYIEGHLKTYVKRHRVD